MDRLTLTLCGFDVAVKVGCLLDPDGALPPVVMVMARAILVARRRGVDVDILFRIHGGGKVMLLSVDWETEYSLAEIKDDQGVGDTGSPQVPYVWSDNS